MRTFTDTSTMTVNYPDNQVFSGDLNRIKITKNTTATHVEISFIINGFTYNQNLYFLTSTLEFSFADVLGLLFDRSFNSIFDTTKQLNFTIKLYNNTSLLDNENFSIDEVILGKRKIFDKIGVVPNASIFDFDSSIGVILLSYYFYIESEVYAKLLDSSSEFIDTYDGVSIFDLSEIVNLDYIYYKIPNLIKNSNFQYLDGTGNGWNENQWAESEFVGCDSYFKISESNNKLTCLILDVSCGDTFEIQYLGGSFVVGQSYELTIVVDEVNNPSSEAQFIQFNLGGTLGVTHSGTGTFTETLVCGSTGVLKLKAYMDADTGGFGAHAFMCTSISIKDNIEYKININNECEGVGEKIGLRFLNRFGMFKNYYVIKKTSSDSSGEGIPLWFLEDNATEYNGLFSEQQKTDNQNITVFREGLTKELFNDFKDIIKSDHVHLYDEINSVWIPVRVMTNNLSINEKDSLFDVSLNLLLQSNE